MTAGCFVILLLAANSCPFNVKSTLNKKRADRAIGSFTQLIILSCRKWAGLVYLTKYSRFPTRLCILQDDTLQFDIIGKKLKEIKKEAPYFFDLKALP